MASQIKLELTEDEISSVLRFLGKQPFEEVAALIARIKAQCEPEEEVRVDYDE
ncbi:MAG: hypothetical protein H6R17_4157 [Proteobacteria bacterium]|nr:hypothetical protein [Pseudomonadota bacterium]